MNSRRTHDPLDRAIREGNSYSNIVLRCLIGAAALVVTLLILVAKVIS